MSIPRWLVILTALAVMLVASACGGAEEQIEPTPTRTPQPTFTATPEGQVANQHLFEADVSQPQATSDIVVILPTDTPTTVPTATPTMEPPTETPLPPTPTTEPASVLVNNPVVNVRRGPGTGYGVVGQARNGETYLITGKNPAGSWWQIDFNGREGWLTGSLVTTQGQLDTVQVVAAIPPAPAATPRPPAPTPVPVPTQPPAPRYEFNVALVQACRRQPAGNWFEGTVYKGGQPANGYRVVFSFSPDGSWATPPQISGPHPGYEGWKPGFYSHIIRASEPQAGNWFVWIVDANGNRISEMANFQTTGPGDGCNEAVVDFDSR